MPFSASWSTSHAGGSRLLVFSAEIYLRTTLNDAKKITEKIPLSVSLYHKGNDIYRKDIKPGRVAVCVEKSNKTIVLLFPGRLTLAIMSKAGQVLAAEGTLAKERKSRLTINTGQAGDGPPKG